MKRTLLSGLAASALAVAVIAHLSGTAATTVVAAAKGNCSAVPTASQLK